MAPVTDRQVRPYAAPGAQRPGYIKWKRIVTVDGVEALTTTLSATGLFLQADDSLPQSGDVTIRLPGLRGRKGKIVLRVAGFAGIEFATPLTLAEFDALTAQPDLISPTAASRSNR